MRVTDRQAGKLLMEYQKSGEVGMAALKAGMHRGTAGKYTARGLLPSQGRVDRDWLTRLNPFERVTEEPWGRNREPWGHTFSAFSFVGG